MERITITIETGNAAFEGSPTSEISRLLRNLAHDFEQRGLPREEVRDGMNLFRLRDIDGKVCGAVRIDQD